MAWSILFARLQPSKKGVETAGNVRELFGYACTDDDFFCTFVRSYDKQEMKYGR